MKIDDEIIQHAMDEFGISKEEVEKQIQKLVDMGLLQKNDGLIMPSEFKLTNNGSRYAEDAINDQYGEFKKVIDHNGIAHRVPTIVIIREGIKGKDLCNFPLWDNEK